nr:S9 family peptidase [Erythrobacter ramosus]
MVPPLARRERREFMLHGRTRVDEYSWMEDDRWPAMLRDGSPLKPEMQAFIDAENQYGADVLSAVKELQADIARDMERRVPAAEAPNMVRDGEWLYYQEVAAGENYARYFRKAVSGGDAELLLDVVALAAGQKYFDVFDVIHSPDHRWIAWAVDVVGDERYDIFLKNTSTGEVRNHGIAGATQDFVFSGDSEWIFWVYQDDKGVHTRIARTAVANGETVTVHAETDPGMFLATARSRSGRYLALGVRNQETSEVYLIPADRPTEVPQLVKARQVGVRYRVEHWEDRFVIHTNADGANDFKLMWADETAPNIWRPWFVPPAGVNIDRIMAFRDFLVRVDRVDASNRMVIIARETLQETPIAFDEDTVMLSPLNASSYADNELLFIYSSMATPQHWFAQDLNTGRRTLTRKRVVGGVDPKDYITRRLFATAKDGEKVPITILARRDTKLDGSAPLYLEGYGAYGVNTDPSFSSRYFSLVDRGWIYALAHVRGGADKGWRWFQDGRTFKKKNSFTDYIAVAERLIDLRYTSKGRIVAYGRSAGGLLVGAVVNMRPDLWGAVVAAVPFVDVLGSMIDPNLPLTQPEFPEWGNPIADVRAYDYIASYSPYQNVEAKAYPPMLITGGVADPRIAFWQPAKWTAALQARSTSRSLIVMQLDDDAGHSGNSSRAGQIARWARDYAFAIGSVERRWSASTA